MFGRALGYRGPDHCRHVGGGILVAAVTQAGRGLARSRHGLAQAAWERVGCGSGAPRVRCFSETGGLRAVEPYAVRWRQLRAERCAAWCRLLPRAVEPAQKPRLKAEAAARQKPRCRGAVEAAQEAGSRSARRKLEAAAAVSRCTLFASSL
jgi:hypothetical protein